jgi:hypothetical protein
MIRPFSSRPALIGWLLFIFLLLTGCDGQPPADPPVLPAASPAEPSPTPFQPLPPTQGSQAFIPEVHSQSPTPEVFPTITTRPQESPPADEQAGIRLWAAPYLPAALRNDLVIPHQVVLSQHTQGSEIRLEVGGENPVSGWVYVLAVPFPTVQEQAGYSELRRFWSGESAGLFADSPLLLDQGSFEIFSLLWGEPGSGQVLVLGENELLEYAWSHRPAWALLPFERLEPRWKVLEVDGQSPLHKDFDLSAYPLVVSFSLNSDVLGPEYMAEAARALPLPRTNRDPDRLTTLAMTGVTAMVRCTAYFMEQRGITYPGQDIGDILVNADLAHISNEIPFAPGCPFPSCYQEGLVFCSSPRYIELLEALGTDIVELTGDHFADWGPDAMYYTLEMYRERGWAYYGGGQNLQEGLQPLLIEHNSNRLAFLGCNGKAAAGYATASDTQPGAVRCDWSYLDEEIERLKEAGYIPIVTFQHEEYYRYDAAPALQRDFQRVAEAGAQIVSGSQAHQPHGMEFFQGAFLHYGLGNLFFDQFSFCIDNACDHAFIDRHVFYDGRHISTELIPIQFVDWARPRLMTTEERQTFLRLMFNASGW